MANTLKDQIDNIIGSGLASTLYDNWLVAGARTIVDILKPEDLERHSSSVAVPITTGLSVSLYRIWRVLVGGYDAAAYPTGYETQLVDSNSFHQSSAFTPAYIINAGTLKTYNGANCAGTLIGIAYPTGIDSSVATDVAGVPENMHYATILYAAIQARIKQMSNIVDNMTTELATSFQTLAAVASPIIAVLDISTQLARLEAYILTAEDIELAQAEMQQIQTMIEYWNKYTEQKVKAEYEVQIGRLGAQLNTMKSKVEIHSQQTQAYALGLQQLQSEYHGLIDLYLGRVPQQGGQQ
jgi:hypothetical protein